MVTTPLRQALMTDDTHDDDTNRNSPNSASNCTAGSPQPTRTTRRGAMKALGALSFGSIVATKGARAQSSDRVSKSLARAMAEAKVEQLAGDDELQKWNRTDVGSATLFKLPVSENSTTNFEPAVYVFPVTNEKGHIVISARKQLPPVLGYGTSPAPQSRLRRLSNSAIHDSLTFDETLLYLGGMSYGVAATDPTAGDDEQTRFVDLRTGHARPLPTVSGIHRFESSTHGAKTEWRTVQEASPEQHVRQIGIQRSTDEDVPGVPNWTEGDTDDSWNEWDGCSPIAASMAIGHHEGTSYSDRDALIDSLHQKMSTRDVPGAGSGLTIPGDIPRGIRKYDSGDNDYESPENNFVDVGLTRPEQTKNQIDDGNPLLLSTMPLDVSLVGHTETVVGYDDASNFYYKCHDTYGGTSWIRHKNWLTGFTTPVTPA